MPTPRPRARRERRRTHYSILIDALTAGVVLYGFTVLRDAFPMPKDPFPVNVVAELTWDTLARLLVFAALFYFILSDWAAARRVDLLSPQRPSPGGIRFYLDAIIVSAFIPAFHLAAKSDCRLAFWLGIIFLLCLAWCLVVGTRPNVQPEAKAACRRFSVTHLSGAVMFGVLTLAFSRMDPEPNLMWWVLAVYGLWEIGDHLGSRWLGERGR